MKSRKCGLRSNKRKLLPVKRKTDKYYDIKEITLKNDKKSVFQLFKEYINSLEIDQLFTRSDLFHAVYCVDIASTLLQRENTVDLYRNYSTVIGFLQKTDKRGQYIKKHNIPDNVNSQILSKYAYNKDWTTWFIPIEKA